MYTRYLPASRKIPEVSSIYIWFVACRWKSHLPHKLAYKLHHHKLSLSHQLVFLSEVLTMKIYGLRGMIGFKVARKTNLMQDIVPNRQMLEYP